MLGKDEILNLLLQNQYPEFFEALDTHGLDTSEYNQLKLEFVGGKTDVHYNNRCKVLTNQFFKTKESLKSFEKQQEEAIKWFKKGYETDNHHLKVNFYTKAIQLGYRPLQDAYNNRGFAKHYLEDYKDAITDYDQAIYLQPDYANAYTNRGAAKDNLKDYKGAISDYDQAIYLQPDEALTYANRGAAKASLKDYQGAVTDYSQAIALKHHKVWKVHNYRGYCYYVLGSYETAIADWKKMKETAPADYIPFHNYIDDARKKVK